MPISAKNGTSDTVVRGTPYSATMPGTVKPSEAAMKAATNIQKALMNATARRFGILTLGLAGLIAAPRAALAQDPAKAAPDHYKLKLESDGRALVEGKALRRAIEQGATLDALQARSGDQLVLPSKQHGDIYGPLRFVAVLLGIPLVVGRDEQGRAFAMRDSCPHRGMPLSYGAVYGQQIECPYHGWRFDVHSGTCREIPSLTADSRLNPEKIHAIHYPCEERDGYIWAFIPERRSSSVAAPPVPSLPVYSARYQITHLAADLPCNVDHGVIGLMDPAHGPYVHQQWWWRSKASQHEKAKRFEPREAGFAMVRHEPSKNSRAYAILGGEPLTEITFRIPGLRWEHVTVGDRQVLSLTCLTPVSEAKTRITQLIWSDHPVFFLARPFIRAGARRFLKQDGDMVNLQNQGLRYDPSLMWIDDADRQAKWYQALKREWAASRREGRAFVNPVEAATLKWRS